jgi:hypothetical protein
VLDGCEVVMVLRPDLGDVPMLICAFICIRPGLLARTGCADQYLLLLSDGTSFFSRITSLAVYVKQPITCSKYCTRHAHNSKEGAYGDNRGL